MWKIAAKWDGEAWEVLRKYRTESAARMCFRLAVEIGPLALIDPQGRIVAER